jgi:serine/threonine-protein kinase
VLVLGVVAAWVLTRDRLSATAVRSDDLVRSIAVLQLENASADTGLKFFVVGTTAEIATALGKIPGIRIPSRSVTDNAPGANAQAKGAALGVAAVFEGQVFRDRDSLRLTLQLTKVADGLSLWSESYHVLASGAFAVQDSVARAVASALKIKLSATEQAKLVSSGTKSTKAHDLSG